MSSAQLARLAEEALAERRRRLTPQQRYQQLVESGTVGPDGRPVWGRAADVESEQEQRRQAAR